MRIGLFHTTLPETGRKPGGVEVWVPRLADRLAGRGHDVTLLSFCEAPAGAGPVRHVQLGSRAVARGGVRRLGLVPLLLNRRLPDHGLDVLHLHGDDWFYVDRPLPTVRTFYGSAWHEARHAVTFRRRSSRALVYLGELAASRLATGAYAIAPGMPPGYHLDGELTLAVDDAAAATGRSPRPAVLFVGTWEGRKRGRFLRDVFLRDVRPHVPDAELWMVSDHCEAGDGVRSFGRPDDARLRELYGAAWAFCLPSTYEGFGMPYLEAMVSGTPVVATPNTGARHVLAGGRAGVLARDEDLGGAIVALLRDHAACSRVAVAGRERARDFGWDRVLDEHESAYARAIAAQTGRPR